MKIDQRNLKSIFNSGRVNLLIFLMAGLLIFSGIGSLAIAKQDSAADHPVKTSGVGVLAPSTFADVAQDASPAVINISTTRVTKGASFQFQGPSGMQRPFEDFFEKFFGQNGPSGEYKQKALGSGFIIDPSGLAITNNHVVEGASEIMVKTADGKEFKAEVMGRDPKTDLALIKIDAKQKFPYLALGDSQKIRTGDWVVAIGNPFGLEHTVTSGILSAKGRTIGAGPYDDFLQTNASINPGNSGGPLLNLNGEVIGINTAIIPYGQGIGFAIPSNMAKNIVSQLKSGGKVVRGWLGVYIQELTPELAKAFDLEENHGVLVADVSKDSPADHAGLERGDIITSFNGRPIKESSELPAVVANTPIGEKVEVKAIRKGKDKTFEVKIAELQEDKMALAK